MALALMKLAIFAFMVWCYIGLMVEEHLTPFAKIAVTLLYLALVSGFAHINL